MNKYLKLGKFTISLPVALTGFLGYFLANPSLDPGALYTVLGVLHLSLGSSAMNQIQERQTDALMSRTSKRPLPSGEITPRRAILFFIICVAAGSTLLMLTGQVLAMIMGLFTVAWYNLVYTPLKRVTAFAVLPGALIGALPPLIGWTAAGGDPLDMEIIVVAFILFVGQMPHYWLLLIKIGQEFHEAGLPVITSLLDKRQIRNLSFMWIATTGACVLMLPATPIIRHRLISVFLIVAALLFLFRMFQLSYREDLLKHWKKAFITVNLFYLLIILALIADRIF
jgi:protoheme IX farnesyltransferase